MNVYHLTNRIYKEFKDIEFKPHPILFARGMIQGVVNLGDDYKVSVVRGLAFDDPLSYEVALIKNDSIINESVRGHLRDAEEVSMYMRELQTSWVVK